MRVLGLALLAACGRIGFASLPPPSGDAVLADVVTTDSALDGPAVCTALFCDGFEAGIGASWTIDTASGTAVPSGTQVHGGAKSVGLVTNAITSSTTNPRASLSLTGLLPVTGATIYARAWFYLQSPFDTTATFAQMINFANSSGTGISIGARHGVITANDYTSGGYMESATKALPLDTWFCLQMEMPNNSTSTVRTFVDGVEVTDIALTKSTAQPVSDQFYVGFLWANTITSQAKAQGWIDDVAIDTSPIGCN